MRESSRISELRSALRRQGVWGMRAERLLQDWTEHVRDDAAHRIAEGGDPHVADEAAWKSLGGADILAASARRELTRASWLGRHPWLGGAALPAGTWLIVAAAVLFTPWLIPVILRMDWVHVDSNKVFSVMHYWQHVFNWLPWLLSVAWLARLGIRMPGGWKLFWITAVALTLCSTSLHMAVYPPMHGQGSGKVIVHTAGALGLIAMTIAQALGFGAVMGSWEQVVGVSQAVPWLQTALMICGIAAFRFKVRAAGPASDATKPLAG